MISRSLKNAEKNENYQFYQNHTNDKVDISQLVICPVLWYDQEKGIKVRPCQWRLKYFSINLHQSVNLSASLHFCSGVVLGYDLCHWTNNGCYVQPFHIAGISGNLKVCCCNSDW